MEMIRTSSLPPSMARRERRERCKSAGSQISQKSSTTTRGGHLNGRDSAALGNGTSILLSEKSKTSALTTTLPPHGNNLAAILRAQAAREKLERDMQERLEEKRREQIQQLRKALTAKKPAWRALRTAARHEHERDLDFRVALRRVEAHEQAEQHRIQMEMMLDRVMKIPTLFERHSQEGILLQSFQNCLKMYPKFMSESSLLKSSSDSTKYQYNRHCLVGKDKICSSKKKKKKKNQPKHQQQQQQDCSNKKLVSSSSAESYASLGSSSRPCSGSPESSISSGDAMNVGNHRGDAAGITGTQSCVLSCKETTSEVSAALEKKRSSRSLRVSINDKAEFIGTAASYEEDAKEETFSTDSIRQEREKRVLDDVDEITEKE